jgi:hypothetical protein
VKKLLGFQNALVTPPTFKASSGWLDAFCKRNQIVFRVLNGEAGSLDGAVVAEWRERLPSLLRAFDQKDIFNCDETALFFRSLPTRSFVGKADSCKGGKTAKERLTLLFCASATGEKLRPLVIWKSLRPRCFGRRELS